MNIFFALTTRNIKLFFKDKGMFFTSLATPMILLVLYATFLRNVYRDVFVSVIPESLGIAKKVIDGLVGGQLVSSLLSVSCVTVAFCSNFLSVQDRVMGVRGDFDVSPVKSSVLSFSYYISSLASTLIICLITAVIGFIYLAFSGWYLSAADVALLLLDVFLLAMFGTALSSIINLFLTSQGQISAVGSIISSIYGFICGAYMPMSQFGDFLQKVLTFFPGTYGTALTRTHAMRGAFAELERSGIPHSMVEEMMRDMDCTVRFFNNPVSEGAMFAIISGTVIILCGIYILLSKKRTKKNL